MNTEEIIDGIYLLPQTSKDMLPASVSEVEYPKGFRLLCEDRKGAKSYFIRKGIVRSYARKQAKEVTFWFGKEGDIISPLQTLYADRGEYGCVELLEDSVLYELNLDRLQELYLRDIHIANWDRRYAEYSCIKSEKQYISRQFKTSAERHRLLSGHFTGLLEPDQSFEAANLAKVKSFFGKCKMP